MLLHSPSWAENYWAQHWNGLASKKPMILGLLEKDVKLFMGQALESCKEGIRRRVPLCLLYLTAEQRRSAGSHRTAHKMFVVATVCTQGRRML